MSDVQLLVDGRAYSGWKSADVRLGVDRMAGTFELRVSELWPRELAAREIPVGAKCELRLQDETVITGYVDDNDPAYDHESHDVTVRGRDATGDLVDCAAVYGSGQWNNRTLLQIAQDLCKPFGVKVKATTDVGAPFSRSTAIQQGETVHELLDRLARHRGVMLMSDGRGSLLIARAGKARLATPLVLGQNVIAARGTRSHRDRFSKYLVIGQGVQADGQALDVTVAPSGSAEDAAVKRYRPMIIMAEETIQPTAAKDRATWERNRRAARAVNITYTVQGWAHNDGLWRPDTLVAVRDPFMRVERDLYISAVGYKLGEDGATAELTLTLPEAFSLLAIPEKEEML
jgi:prophage tail gpP-like protein